MLARASATAKEVVDKCRRILRRFGVPLPLSLTLCRLACELPAHPSMTPADLRLIRLSCTASLRSAGAVPWVLLLGWIVLSAAQEPVFLRGYGLRILDQAAWAGTAVLLGVVWNEAIGRCRRMIPRAVTGLVLLALLAVVMTVFPCGVELVVRGACDVRTRFAQSAGFFVTWCATAIAATSVRPPARRTALVFLLAQVLCAVAISARLSGSGWSPTLTAAVALAIVAAALGVDISSQRTQ
jgi:hypothetical protein